MKSPLIWTLVALCLSCSWACPAHAQSDEPDEEAIGAFLWPDRETGFWLTTEALLWRRNNSGGSGPVIGGPESLRFGGSEYHYEGGYRVGVGWLIDPNYELEGVWTSLSGWSTGQTGVLTRAISFDDGQASLWVDPTGDANFINQTTFFRPLYDAATNPDIAGGGANDETDEFEFIQPGSAYSLKQSSNLYDIQLNVKTRRTEGQRYGFGLGFRHVTLSEAALAQVSGTFDAFDIDGDEVVVDDGNDQLSDAVLLATGLQLINGSGGFYDPGLGGGVFTMLWNGTASNQLNGLQGTFDAAILERGRYSLDGNLRLGLFHNRIRGTVTETYADSLDSVYRRSFEDESDKLSFGANLGLSSSIRISERIKLRSGYEAMFLTNTALGPSQQQGLVYDGLGNATYSVQAADTLIMQGLRAGIEMEW